jgi:hypothetical protein
MQFLGSLGRPLLGSEGSGSAEGGAANGGPHALGTV